jgi:hypothetical protein
MTNQPKASGRTAGGTFAPGNSFGEGRPRGSRNKVTEAIEALLAGEHEKLTHAVIDKALEGDTTALRLCLDRLAPLRKDAPVSFTLPPIRTAADAIEASSALLAAVAAGEVTPDEAGRHGFAHSPQGAGRNWGSGTPHRGAGGKRMRAIERRVRVLEARMEALEEKRIDDQCAALLRSLSDAELEQGEALAIRLEAGESLESQSESDRQLIERMEALWAAIAT